MTAEIKIIAVLAGILALFGGGLWLHHSGYTQGDAAGSSRVQLEWDRNIEEIQRMTAKAIADATAERDKALAANEGISNDYQAQLSAAHANAAVFAQRLRDYQARATTDSGAVPKAGSGQGAAATSAKSAQEAGIYERLADYDASCQADAAQLNALIAELKPQL
jgi:hypothetical protein